MTIDPQTLNPVRLSLTLRQRAALQEQASREGRSVSEIVRQAVDAHLMTVQTQEVPNVR
jgi:hypothetical protein